MCEYRYQPLMVGVERPDGVIFMGLAGNSPVQIRREAARIFDDGARVTLPAYMIPGTRAFQRHNACKRGERRDYPCICGRHPQHIKFTIDGNEYHAIELNRQALDLSGMTLTVPSTVTSLLTGGALNG